MTSADAFRLTRQILSHEGAAAAAAASADAQARRIGALGSFAAFHGVFELPLQIVTSLLIACRLAAADKETGISFLQVYCKTQQQQQQQHSSSSSITSAQSGACE